jgi:hypothetical protein
LARGGGREVFIAAGNDANLLRLAYFLGKSGASGAINTSFRV